MTGQANVKQKVTPGLRTRSEVEVGKGQLGSLTTPISRIDRGCCSSAWHWPRCTYLGSCRSDRPSGPAGSGAAPRAGASERSESDSDWATD